MEEENEIGLKQHKTLFNDFILQMSAFEDYVLHTSKEYVKRYISINEKLWNNLEMIKKNENLEESSPEIFNTRLINNKILENEIILNMIPESVIVTLVSIFDYYLMSNLKNIMISNNNLIHIIDSKLLIKDLQDAKNLDDIKNIYVENFLDKLMRENHINIFNWVKKNLNIDSIQKHPNWESLIVFLEMRNLIVHNNSTVNFQFINRLKENGINTDNYKINEKIETITIEDTIIFMKILISLAIELFSLMGLKFFKGADELEDGNIYDYIDDAINDYIFKLLCENKYKRVMETVETVLQTGNHTSSYNFILNINLCIAYKKTKKKNKLRKTLENLDWSNCNDEFKYAKSVLLEDYEESLKYMENLKDFKEAYHFWPLFSDFIKTNEFKKKYLELYNEKFSLKKFKNEITERDLKKANTLLNKAMKAEAKKVKKA